MEELIMKHLNDCSMDSKSIYGWLEDEDKLERLVKVLRFNGVSFVTRNSRLSRKLNSESFHGKTNVGTGIRVDTTEDGEGVKSNKDVHFQLKSRFLSIPLLPFPFMCSRYIMKDCVYGTFYQSWENKLRNKKENVNVNNKISKRHKLATKKMECKACMYIKEIIIYPKYTLHVEGAMKPFHIKRAKRVVRDKLKNDIRMGVETGMKSRFYVAIPLTSTHNHIIEVISSLPKNLDPIKKVAEKGVCDDIDDGLTMESFGDKVECYSSVVDTSDIDFIATDNTALATQQEIHLEVDIIKNISCLSTDVEALRQCIDSLKDVRYKLSSSNLKSVSNINPNR